MSAPPLPRTQVRLNGGSLLKTPLEALWNDVARLGLPLDTLRVKKVDSPLGAAPAETIAAAVRKRATTLRLVSSTDPDAMVELGDGSGALFVVAPIRLSADALVDWVAAFVDRLPIEDGRVVRWGDFSTGPFQNDATEWGWITVLREGQRDLVGADDFRSVFQGIPGFRVVETKRHLILALPAHADVDLTPIFDAIRSPLLALIARAFDRAAGFDVAAAIAAALEPPALRLGFTRDAAPTHDHRLPLIRLTWSRGDAKLVAAVRWLFDHTVAELKLEQPWGGLLHEYWFHEQPFAAPTFRDVLNTAAGELAGDAGSTFLREAAARVAKKAAKGSKTR